jgi:hypothetical protein
LIRILKRYEVDYVLVGRRPLARNINKGIRKGASSFTKMNSPGKRYAVYKVNLQKLKARR